MDAPPYEVWFHAGGDSRGGDTSRRGIGRYVFIGGNDVNVSSAEAHRSGRDRKQRVIAAALNEIAGLESRSALADENVP